jgi:hypothetical protein
MIAGLSEMPLPVLFLPKERTGKGTLNNPYLESGKMPGNPSRQTRFISIAFAVLLLMPDAGLPQGGKIGGNSPQTQNAVKDLWGELLERTPFPYTIPLVAKPTGLDGTYVKKAKNEGPIVPCRRCPDWMPYPGNWKLDLSQGVYRIYHRATGWKSIGTCILAGNRMILANDPSCIKGIGVYTWKLDAGKLIFKVIDDECAIKLRALNLTEVPWILCQPPCSESAATTGE